MTTVGSGPRSRILETVARKETNETRGLVGASAVGCDVVRCSAREVGWTLEACRVQGTQHVLPRYVAAGMK